jgi:hypothetical protein
VAQKAALLSVIQNEMDGEKYTDGEYRVRLTSSSNIPRANTLEQSFQGGLPLS